MISAIIVCAGSGSRFDNEKNKVLFEIDNKRIFEYSVDILEEFCNEIIIVCKKEEEHLFKYKNVVTVIGGEFRHLSVLNGLNKCNNDIVLVHDGARPFVKKEDISILLEKIKSNDAVYLGNKVTNTIRTVNNNTLDRNTLIEATTPQVTYKNLLSEGINYCIKNNIMPTDDISCIEYLNKKIEVVYSSNKNIKITTKEDYMNNFDIRIGHSFDIHRLVENRDLFLGGIKFDFHLGLLGHSDADCLLHAIAECLLGALSLGDLGTFFPDNDPKYKNIDSKTILKEVYEMIKEKGYVINNIDSTLYLELPKINPHVLSIRESISNILNIDIDLISVKATTYEKLGPIGEGLAIAAESVCMLRKKTI